MKVELHDLKQSKWFLEAEPTDTIERLKALNATQQSLDESANQKMIYSGKILKDTDTMESIKYTEGKGYIVCMVSKKVARPAAKKTASPASEVRSGENATSATSGAPASVVGSKADANGPSTLAIGKQLDTAISNIVEMGYTRSQAVSAMRRAFNNPDRAVEYLITGQIPDTLVDADNNEQEDDADMVQQHSESSATNDGPNEHLPSTIDMNLIDGADSEDTDHEMEEGGEFQGYNFKEIMGLSDEEMMTLRQAAISNPETLISLLQPVIVNNPQLASFLMNNMDEFLAYIDAAGEPNDEEMMAEHERHSGNQPQTIEITAEEDAAIKRLMELGFDRHIVATAYLACDKDEMLTANYLLEHGYDD